MNSLRYSLVPYQYIERWGINVNHINITPDALPLVSMYTPLLLTLSNTNLQGRSTCPELTMQLSFWPSTLPHPSNSELMLPIITCSGSCLVWEASRIAIKCILCSLKHCFTTNIKIRVYVVTCHFLHFLHNFNNLVHDLDSKLLKYYRRECINTIPYDT